MVRSIPFWRSAGGAPFLGAAKLQESFVSFATGFWHKPRRRYSGSGFRIQSLGVTGGPGRLRALHVANGILRIRFDDAGNFGDQGRYRILLEVVEALETEVVVSEP